MSTNNMQTVSVIGSGNFGTAIGRLIARNVQKSANFNKQITTWVFEEMIENRKLSDIINEENMNTKYLPGVDLPTNLVAQPDLLKCATADILIFVVPHQFLKRTLMQIKEIVKKDVNCLIMSKGLIFEDNKLVLLNEVVSRELNVPCSVCVGANIATEIAHDVIAESTLAARTPQHRQLFHELLHCYNFRVACCDDVTGAEICGLKNIVAIAYGVGVGLGYGANTNVAIFRNGLKELRRFAKKFFEVDSDIFFESCGIADLLVSCLAGRNYKAGLMLAQKMKVADIEKEFGGQQLQGMTLAKEIYGFLVDKEMTQEFPLFVFVYRLVYESEPADSVLETVAYELGENV